MGNLAKECGFVGRVKFLCQIIQLAKGAQNWVIEVFILWNRGILQEESIEIGLILSSLFGTNQCKHLNCRTLVNLLGENFDH
jgi:hypothetical protein